jgi:hypothetical protein
MPAPSADKSRRGSAAALLAARAAVLVPFLCAIWATANPGRLAAEPTTYKDWTILGHGGYTRATAGGKGFFSISCLQPGAENPVYMPALHVPAKPRVSARASTDASGTEAAEITEIHIQVDASEGRLATAIILPPKDGLYPVFPAWLNSEGERLKRGTSVAFRYRQTDGEEQSLRFSLMGFTRSLQAALSYCTPEDS